ncbi:hypothetical protein BCU68_01300 [Vibrio sp. 10N.286.49.B3]|nr:hypothetical protein BCU68_01300 [Vibrio sp. 10N.286.49.B3]
MKNKPWKAIAVAVSLCMASGVQASSVDNQALSYYCGGKNVEFEKHITVGKGTRVFLNEGPFYQIEQAGEYEPTLDFINKQIISTGVNEDCSEFLLTNGLFKPVNDDGVIARVYFDFNKATLTDQSRYVLDNVIRLIKMNTQDIVLEGHTDEVGSHDYNFSLGLKRSQAVEQHLTRLGVDPGLVDSVSRGKTQPIASNSTAEGRAQNRRVEIK